MTIKLSATRLDLGTARLDNAAVRSSSQTLTALGSVSGATTINLALGSVFTATIAGATTFSVTNLPSSTQYCSFTLILTNGGRYAVTWPTGTIWQNGSAPTLTAVGGTDVLTFFTVDNGAIWRGSFAVPNISSSGSQMFVWGQASYGRLGVPDLANRSSPIQLAGTWAVLSVATYHGAAVKTDGSLWVWGGFDGIVQGALGLGDTINRSSPTQVPGTWVSVSAFGSNTAALKADGSLWMWGNGTAGALGVGDTIDRSSPVQVAGTWSKINGGFYGVRALRSNNTLWTWGDNFNGALGLGDTDDRSSPVQIGAGTWSDVASTGYTGLALKADGTLFTWGRNHRGQLGLGDMVYRSSPVQIAGTSWSILGSNMSKETHVIRSDGSMWGFGENNQGQIGIGDTVNRSSPVQVAGTWSAVSGGQAPHVGLKTDGSLFAWGEGTHGRLGLGDTNNRSSPAQISGTWTQISTCGGRVQGAFRL